MKYVHDNMYKWDEKKGCSTKIEGFKKVPDEEWNNYGKVVKCDQSKPALFIGDPIKFECPECKSANIRFDSHAGFASCLDCFVDDQFKHSGYFIYKEGIR